MATSTNSKVFVSPGVYTSEVDLSFVSQSVGVTTLGIVGETLKGPAFEPIFIRNYDEFSLYFGGTSPEKFINTQIPKYEAAYIAKSYLQQSNQLFVTRILGLSGYDAGPSWSIKTIANVDQSTVGFECTSSTTLSCITQCVQYNVVPYSFDFTGCTNNIESISYVTPLPNILSEDINDLYEQFNGSVSNIGADLNSQIFSVLNSPSSSAFSINYFGVISGDTYETLSGYTDDTNVFNVSNVNSNNVDYTDPLNDAWYYATFDHIGNNSYSGYSFYSTVPSLTLTSSQSNCASFYSYEVSSSTISTVVGNINYLTNTINICLPSTATTADTSAMTITYSACTTGVTSDAVLQSAITENYDFSALTKSYVLTSEDGTVTTNWTVNVYVNDPCGVCVSGNTGTIDTGTITNCFSGTISGNIYVFSANSFSDYDNLVVATLRSRGLTTYSSDNEPTYEVTGSTNVFGSFIGDDVTLDCLGNYSAATKNPFSTFGINVTNIRGENLFFETSFLRTDTNFITKVFGQSNFSKPRTTVPLFVEEEFTTLLNYAYRKGYIRGLDCQLTALPNARQGVDPTSIAFYLEKYQSPISPWLVSEVRGNKVYNLFRFMTIADGNAANTELKISVANISFNNGSFDLLIRDYFDTDSAPVVLEKFTNCNMDPNDNNFVAKKIGTIDGEYQLNSKYVMIEINEDAPVDALPCGFLGYNFREYGDATPPFPIYKTKYNFPGEVIWNPPFGLSTGGDDQILSNGDNVRKTYLGMSNSDDAGYDVDFFGYKGKQLPTQVCTAIEGNNWAYRTKGFHMDIMASAITIPDIFVTSGESAFYVGSATFQSEPETETSPYYRLFSRKFTFFVQGGFDGWDIYREYRTNGDRFALGRNGYLRGACSSTNYPTATGWGAFKQITVGDNSVDWANTDYYAYKLGINTFSNPEAVNINLFVTPGVDYVNNSDVVEHAIDVIENDRADSLYICTTPDFQMFTPSSTNPQDLIYPQEAVDNLDQTGIDSNYTATYYPWVLTRDSVNNTQVYIPPTAEVTRNLALTDNIAFPWFAAAGYTRGIVNSIKARKKLTQEDRDVLYKGRINPIATFSDVGTVIWGNKTLQVRESALDRINVRRLLLQARKLISAVSIRLLFEQNDAVVRQQFLDTVNPILDAIRRDRGLYDFRVTVSSDPADLDRNQLTGKIYIKPTKSLEFIDITFYITPTGASFENI
jgi:hypothetical protein